VKLNPVIFSSQKSASFERENENQATSSKWFPRTTQLMKIFEHKEQHTFSQVGSSQKGFCSSTSTTIKMNKNLSKKKE